jgi:hypothetical protein
MIDNLGQQIRKHARVRGLFMTALVFGCAFGTVNNAAAQRFTPPQTSTAIAAPEGNSLFLAGHAVGTQGYVCLPTTPGSASASWTAKDARPEATLFGFFGQDNQIITHFLSPDTNPNKFAPIPVPFGSATWQSSFDSSKVWAQRLHAVPAGSEPSCPNTGAIACLLLQSIGTDEGPGGGKLLTKTTFIQRLNTKGGAAPADGCSDGNDVGKQTLVPYSADYYFFRANDRDRDHDHDDRF